MTKEITGNITGRTDTPREVHTDAHTPVRRSVAPRWARGPTPLRSPDRWLSPRGLRTILRTLRPLGLGSIDHVLQCHGVRSLCGVLAANSAAKRTGTGWDGRYGLDRRTRCEQVRHDTATLVGTALGRLLIRRFSVRARGGAPHSAVADTTLRDAGTGMHLTPSR